MDDLISRTAAIEAAIDGADDWDGGYNSERERYIREHMANVPAVDAVQVVRCKDCGYFQANNAEEGDWSGRCTNVYVPMNGMTVDGWWFCADGKREG